MRHKRSAPTLVVTLSLLLVRPLGAQTQYEPRLVEQFHGVTLWQFANAVAATEQSFHSTFPAL